MTSDDTQPSGPPPLPNPVEPATEPTAFVDVAPKPRSHGRLMALDALRGFDMFWILGGDALARALERMDKSPVTETLATQLTHVQWQGFHFYDLIFPLFVFMAGVSTVYSLSKACEEGGRGRAMKRVLLRTLLLFLCGIFYSGGMSNPWPNIRMLGVLQRIAIGYGGAALIFLAIGPKRPGRILAVTAGILAGYWALLSYVPFPDIRLDKESLAPLIAQAGTEDPKTVLSLVQGTTHGHFEPGYNLTNYIDYRYLPGRKYDTYYDPEGILSMFPAIASALLGILAGTLLRESEMKPALKALALLGIGAALVAAGYQWDATFPIVKKLWTSSFVLVAGGFSMMLLGLFYLVIEVVGLRFWAWPFVWIGTNAITLYLLSNLMGYSRIAARLVGGDVSVWLNDNVATGMGGLVQALVSLGIVFLIARFFYKNKIFLRF